MKREKLYSITLEEYAQLATGKRIRELSLEDVPSATEEHWRRFPNLSELNDALYKKVELQFDEKP